MNDSTVPGPAFAPLPLVAEIDERTEPGQLCRAEGDKVRCVACGHRCLIAPGRRGICKVRFNDRGQLRVPFSYVAGVASDPVEKKPFNHVLPGADALTFGMLGCDFHCGYCQNWLTSQALRDATARTPHQNVTPAELVRAAQRAGARLMVSSYNEPLITAEWAAAVFREAVPAGLLCAFVSNGNATAEALDFLKPWLRAYKIDLKGFNDRHYRELGGTLANVMNGIRMVHERGIWLEIVTLLISGFNDDDAELREMAQFLAGISPDIPWHITAFHPDYKMMAVPRTTARQLIRAAEIGVAAGLRYVYAGNAPGGRRGMGKHALPELRGHVDCSSWLRRARLPPHARGPLPRLQREHSGPLASWRRGGHSARNFFHAGAQTCYIEVSLSP